MLINRPENSFYSDDNSKFECFFKTCENWGKVNAGRRKMNYNHKIIAYFYSKCYALIVRTPENFDFKKKEKFQYIST